MRLAGLVLALLLAGVAPAAAATFADWAAVIVSGDDEAAHADVHTEAFDNARRDVAAALERRGFAKANLAQFSVEPGAARRADLPAITATLKTLAQRAPAGCLFYLTSHGSPSGAVLGDTLLRPAMLARTLAAACPARPVIVVVSACFSGVFVPALERPDRLVVTAARRDRASFGCSESDRYPFFDACLIAALPSASDFVDLARRARGCVARKERAEDIGPPSEPQIAIGRRLVLPAFAPTVVVRRLPDSRAETNPPK